MIKIIFILGPYRNLTTMVGAHLNYHENIIVFNHGYYRLKEQGLDFWNLLTEQSLNNFVEFVKNNYLQGKSGTYGGNIELSHAFEKKNSLSKYKKQIPEKKNAKYIIIKESGRITKDLRNNLNDFDKINKLIKKFSDRLLFIRPVRNICQAVISNIQTNHYKYTDYKNRHKRKKDVEFIDFMKWYIKDLYWFYLNKINHNHNFLYFYESNIIDLNKIMCDFLNIDKSKNMIEDIKISNTRKINQEHKNIKNKALLELLNNNEINEYIYKEILKKDIK
jgi:hypothetical protein